MYDGYHFEKDNFGMGMTDDMERQKSKEQIEMEMKMKDRFNARKSDPNAIYVGMTNEEMVQNVKKSGHSSRSSALNLLNVINMGLDLDYQDEFGDTALMLACGLRRNPITNDLIMNMAAPAEGLHMCVCVCCVCVFCIFTFCDVIGMHNGSKY